MGSGLSRLPPASLIPASDPVLTRQTRHAVKFRPAVSDQRGANRQGVRCDQGVQGANGLSACLESGVQRAVDVHRLRIEGQYFERREEFFKGILVSRRPTLGDTEGQFGPGDARHHDRAGSAGLRSEKLRVRS